MFHLTVLSDTGTLLHAIGDATVLGVGIDKSSTRTCITRFSSYTLAEAPHNIYY